VCAMGFPGSIAWHIAEHHGGPADGVWDAVRATDAAGNGRIFGATRYDVRDRWDTSKAMKPAG